ncbi:MAG TPA: ECF-type sigma factor [Bryobacteraceae bacterium]|nr:ECF-type sigma factor [Bryobacteraceae bacterium]
MRDYAREAAAEKRTAGVRIPLHPDLAWVDASGVEMVSLDAALNELQAIDERNVRAIELRYFLGCTREEAAELLGIGHATLDRDLQFAKSWLYRRLTPQL